MKVWNKASMGVGKAAEWDKEYTRMKMTKKQMRVDIIRAGEFRRRRRRGWFRNDSESQSSCVGHAGACTEFLESQFVSSHAWGHLEAWIQNFADLWLRQVLIWVLCFKPVFYVSPGSLRILLYICSNGLTLKLWPCLALWNNRRIWRRLHSSNSLVSANVGFLFSGVISDW